jgi:hypothetical protein
MKNALRAGTSSTLNIYTVGFATGDSQGLLGYATFPADYASNPKDDGVVILYSSLPGGSMTDFNLGRTTTHETGHWVGLYHTFQGGCDGSGDYVSDTPAEASPPLAAPLRVIPAPARVSIVSQPLAPLIWNFVTYALSFPAVHNYMDYSDDSCMNDFTPGQIARLQSQMSTYRGIQL